MTQAATTGAAPPLIHWTDNPPDAAALQAVVALERDGDGWRNRTAHLNVAEVVLGGQTAAHCLLAAAAGKDGFSPRSMHLTFVAAPKADRRWRLEVEPLRDGRRFAQRLVRLTQDGQVMVHAAVLLVADNLSAEMAVEYRPPIPALPRPEDLPDRMAQLDDPRLNGVERAMMRSYPYMEIRRVPAEARGRPAGGGARGYYWLRMPAAAGLDRLTQRALLTVATDYWYTLPLQDLARDAGISDPVLSLSLDHCLWFHEDADCSEWMLFESDGTVATNGNGMKRSMVWSRDGLPLATVEQFALAQLWRS